jgi:hypothetical protein
MFSIWSKERKPNPSKGSPTIFPRIVRQYHSVSSIEASDGLSNVFVASNSSIEALDGLSNVLLPQAVWYQTNPLYVSCVPNL